MSETKINGQQICKEQKAKNIILKIKLISVVLEMNSDFYFALFLTSHTKSRRLIYIFIFLLIYCCNLCDNELVN
jgi:hypothetical protein